MRQKAAYARCTPESALDVCLSYRPEVLVLDAEPLLIDWQVPDGHWHVSLADLVSRARAGGVRTLLVVTNSRRAFPGLDRALTGNLITRAWKPWTSRRRLNLMHNGAPGVVCGDVALTDGLLAVRLGYTFVHLQVADRPLYPRVQDRIGHWLTRRAFAHDSSRAPGRPDGDDRGLRRDEGG
ncbi:hypothetical protein [Kribbella sp. NPDC000426]|uniref:hypothetical protein n=1 Tax=Kribbella sp. NPDC000426 TaxID=3154255 RepID=UPI00332CAB07